MKIPRVSIILLCLIPFSHAFAASLTMTSKNGKVALVTGSTDGIGRHTATRLAQDGYKVVVHGRSQKRIDDTVAEITSKAPGCELVTVLADLGSFEDIRKMSKEIHQKCDRLDLLINNAGVFSQSMVKTVDGNEQTFQVNVLAPFLLTSLLLDLVSKSELGKIIIVSSISQSYNIDFDNLQMEKGFDEHTSYSSSKLCNAMHAFELASRLESKMPNVRCNTLDPGTVNTKMLLAGWGRCGIEIKSANNQHTLATDPSLDGENGSYFVGGRKTKASPPCYDDEKRLRLWKIMEDLTGAKYP